MVQQAPLQEEAFYRHRARVCKKLCFDKVFFGEYNFWLCTLLSHLRMIRKKEDKKIAIVRGSAELAAAFDEVEVFVVEIYA